MEQQVYKTEEVNRTKTMRFLPFIFTGNDPRKGWRIPLDEIKYNEQKDYESGFHYYGARYYDSEALTGWLSVDPMKDKYPSMSPYNYCAWDPVKLVDPDGREFCLNDDIVIKGANNSSVTIKTNIVDVSINIDYDFGGNYVLEGEEVLSAALDLVGIVDPSGVFDGANIVLQAKNGEWGYVALSAVGLIPYVGDIPKIGKIGKDIKILQKEIRSIKVNSINPSGWIEKVSKKGDGKVYCDPNNAQNNIRIMTGNPNSPNPAQRVDYVKYQKNGVFYYVNGKPLVNGRCAEAHIPLSEYNSSVMPPF